MLEELFRTNLTTPQTQVDVLTFFPGTHVTVLPTPNRIPDYANARILTDLIIIFTHEIH